MRLNSAPLFALLIMSVLVISGCTQSDQVPTTAGPSEVSSDQAPPPTTTREEPACTPDWQCSEWSDCSQSGVQTRSCADANDCGVTTDKPTASQSCAPPVVEPLPITLSGSDQEATVLFDLLEGVSIFEMQNTGSGHFGIWLLDDMGENVELLVNEIGPFDGSKIVHINRQGDYLLDVSAEGNWEVTITQPRPTVAPETTYFSGRDQQYAGPFFLDSGLTRFTLHNTGSGHFGIWLLDSMGNYIDLLVNEIGPFDGSKAVGISREGIYYLDISAQGNWEIIIE